MLGDFKSDLIALASEAPGVASQLVSVLRSIRPVLPTVKLVVDDPAFGRVIAQIQELHAIEAARVSSAPATPSTPTSSVPGAGVGLSKAVPLLDAVIYARRHTWAPWAFGAGFLLLIGGIGFKLGRRKR